MLSPVLQHDNVVVLIVAPTGATAQPTRTVERCAFGAGSKPRAGPLVITAGTSPGRAVMLESGCLACHRIGAQGNNGPGPNLTNIGPQLPAHEIAGWLIHPTAPMPSFKGLAARKLQALVSYLHHLRGA
jgi:ubiquinol-cytochrome c reductase cytochrome b subunit/menaquinol-cytochrome c reductase cytochrome b/c subunit